MASRFGFEFSVFWGFLGFCVCVCFFLIQILANKNKEFGETQNLEMPMTLCMGSFLVRCSSMDRYVLNLLAWTLRICHGKTH